MCPHADKCWLGDVCKAVDYCDKPLIDKDSKTKEASNDIRDHSSDK